MIPILMYHQIAQPSPRGTPYRGLTVDPAKFRRQMIWLRRLGYRGLAMRDLLPYVRGERQGRVFGITFDDGYRNVLENALPVLCDLGFTATNYIVAGQMGGGNVWDYDDGVPHADLMTGAEVRAWAASGQEVGSHTMNHPLLPQLQPERAAVEITQSREILEQLIGLPVMSFCYPYGGQTPALRQLVREAGYSNATTTERGLVRADDDLMGLPRIFVARSASLPRFLQKCLTGLEDRRRRAIASDAPHA